MTNSLKKYNWSKQLTELLNYEKERVEMLHDVNHPHYKNVNKIKKLYLCILKIIRAVEKQCTIHRVKVMLFRVRKIYLSEFKDIKSLDLKKENINIPSLMFYPMLSFLETVPDVEFDIYGGQQLAANDNNRRSDLEKSNANLKTTQTENNDTTQVFLNSIEHELHLLENTGNTSVLCDAKNKILHVITEAWNAVKPDRNC